MNVLEGVAELLAWIVLMVGLPLLALGMILRFKERGLVPTELLIVVRQHELRARWFVCGEIYERRRGTAALDSVEEKYHHYRKHVEVIGLNIASRALRTRMPGRFGGGH